VMTRNYDPDQIARSVDTRRPERPRLMRQKGPRPRAWPRSARLETRVDARGVGARRVIDSGRHSRGLGYDYDGRPHNSERADSRPTNIWSEETESFALRAELLPCLR